MSRYTNEDLLRLQLEAAEMKIYVLQSEVDALKDRVQTMVETSAQAGWLATVIAWDEYAKETRQ
jgi:hypothetical protein